MTECDLMRELRKEANRVIIDTEYTGRQHMLCARRWRCLNIWLGVPGRLVAAVASGGAGLSVLLGWEVVATALLAFLGAITSGVYSFFRPDEQELRHSAKGAECIALRNEARRFMNIDLKSQLSLDTLTDRAKTIAKRYDVLRGKEPTGLPGWTYERVKKEIAAGNYNYEDDPLWLIETGQQGESSGY